MRRRLGSVFHLGFDVFLSFYSTFCGLRSFFILFFFCWLGRITFNYNKEKLKIVNTNTEDQHYTMLCWLVIPKVLKKSAKFIKIKNNKNTSWHTWARDAWFVCVRWCITSKNKKTRKENIKLNFYLIITWCFLFIITTFTNRNCFHKIVMYSVHQRENTCSRLFTEVKPCWTAWIIGEHLGNLPCCTP